MPYIDRKRREQVHRRGYALNGAELNYQITYAVDQFLRRGRIVELCYADFAEALAALEGAKREYQRVVMDPYEESKRLHARGHTDPEPLYRGLLTR